MISDLRTMTKTWSGKVTLLTCFVGILLCYMALFSYDRGDLGDTYPKKDSFQNWVGKGGAILANNLYLWFGNMAYLLPLALLLPLLLLISPFSLRYLPLRLMNLAFCTLLWACTFFSFWEKFPSHSDKMPSQGGILGLFFWETGKNFFGVYSSFLLFLVGALLIFEAYTLGIEYHYLYKKHQKRRKETSLQT